MGDDPHVPLSHGAHLLHVVVNLDPVASHLQPHGLTPTPAVPTRPCSAHSDHEPALDTQEDHAAAEPSGLELRQQASTIKWTYRGPT